MKAHTKLANSESFTIIEVPKQIKDRYIHFKTSLESILKTVQNSFVELSDTGIYRLNCLPLGLIF
jgi:hypothetical protein